MIYYPDRPTTYIFWDVQEIINLGLPPPDGKVRYVTLKDSLIVAWFSERPDDWREGIPPTKEIVNSLYIQDCDLYDIFAIIAQPWEHIRASWYRSKDRPRVRAYMLFIIYKAVRKMHQLHANIFDQRLAKMSPKFFDRISTIYRHPPTGGVRPHNPKGEDGESTVDGLVLLELIKQCAPRVLHETSCAADGALPLPNLQKRLAESAEWRDHVLSFYGLDSGLESEQARAFH